MTAEELTTKAPQTTQVYCIVQEVTIRAEPGMGGYAPTPLGTRWLSGVTAPGRQKWTITLTSEYGPVDADITFTTTERQVAEQLMPGMRVQIEVKPL